MQFSAKFDYSKVLGTKAHTLNLLVTAEAPVIDWQTQRKPLNLIAVIDESGSMGGQKIEYAKKSLMKLADHLTGQDRLTVIAFTDGVRVLCEPTLMTAENKDRVKNAVGNLQALASTNFSGALGKAMTMGKETDGQVRVIMFTDGQPTCGETVTDRILEYAKNKLSENVTISTFGYGQDHDSAFLTALANIGKGNYAYIENPDDAPAAFARELGGLLSCYGQDLVFTLTPKNGKSGVKISEVLSDVTVDTKDDVVIIKVPDIYSEEKRQILVAVDVGEQDNIFPREVTLVDIVLDYDDVKTGKRVSLTTKAQLEFVKTEDEAQKDQDATVADQLALVQIQKAQIQADLYASQGNYAGASACMAATMAALPAMASANTRVYGEKMRGLFKDQVVYSANVHDIHASSYSLSKGRGTSSKLMRSAGVVMGSNRVMDHMVGQFDDFGNEVTDAPDLTVMAPPIAPVVTTTVTTTVTKGKAKKSKSLKKDRSGARW